jgi:hypothetical protein
MKKREETDNQRQPAVYSSRARQSNLAEMTVKQRLFEECVVTNVSLPLVRGPMPNRLNDVRRDAVKSARGVTPPERIECPANSRVKRCMNQELVSTCPSRVSQSSGARTGGRVNGRSGAREAGGMERSGESAHGDFIAAAYLERYTGRQEERKRGRCDG